jgi:hypothetical protein
MLISSDVYTLCTFRESPAARPTTTVRYAAPEAEAAAAVRLVHAAECRAVLLVCSLKISAKYWMALTTEVVHIARRAPTHSQINTTAN